MQIQAIFQNIKQTIQNELIKSKKSIIVALAYFNDQDLFEVLCLKAAKGLNVELIVSSEDINYTNSVLNYQRLINCGGNCLFTNGSANGLMHHKFCIIDNSIIITGSYNWTNKAAISNFENIVVLKNSTEIVEKYLEEFNVLKNISSSNLILINNLITANELFISKYKNRLIDNKNNYLLTNILSIDNTMHGFNNSGIYTFAARNAIGSSSFAINIIYNIIKNNKSLIFFSLDLTNNQVIDRLITLSCDIPFAKLTSEELSTSNNSKIKEICSKNLFIDDSPNLTLKDFELAIYQKISNKTIDLVVIDYIELLKYDKNVESLSKTQRDYELDSIFRELKRISKTLKIPFLIISHLKNPPENAGVTKTYFYPEIPNYIEQYSDVVVFLNRLEKYGINEDENGDSLVGKAQLRFTKNNFGPVSEFLIDFNINTLKFSDCKSFDENFII